MDIKIAKTELLRGLHTAASIADRKQTQMILGYTLLRIEGPARLVAAATDTAISGITLMACDAKDEGGIALPSKDIYDIIKGLPSEEVRLTRQDNNWLEARAGKAKFRIAGLAAADFPTLPDATKVKFEKVDAPTLRDLIAKTVIATHPDRMQLSGIWTEREGDRTLFFATDGHRLGLASASLPGFPTLGMTSIPRKGASEIRKAIETREQPIDIGEHDKQLVIRVDESTIFTKLIECPVFPWRVLEKQALDAMKGDPAVVPRRQFRDSVARVLMMSDESSVRMTLTKGALKIESLIVSKGAADDEVDAKYDGPVVKSTVNGQLVAQHLDVMDGGDVRIAFGGGLSPMMFKASEGDCWGVVMPLNPGPATSATSEAQAKL